MISHISVVFLYLQTQLKEETTGLVESILYLTPSSQDDGTTLVCRARNQALPSGKDTAVTLSLQCECSWVLDPSWRSLNKECSGLQTEERRGVDLESLKGWKLEAYTLGSTGR